MYKKREKREVNSTISNTFSSNILKGNKAQVTVFIILGILLLLALMLVVFYKKEIISIKPEEIIPTEKSKIEQTIISCIDEIGDNALFLIGLQGGYIEIPSVVMRDGNARLAVSPSHAIPYWANGQETFIPSLEEIKARMDKYIEDNLRECVFKDQVFSSTYDIIEKSPISSNTEIVDSKVLFNVYWNLEIKNKAGEVISEVMDHTAESPVKLKRLHSLAKRIIEKEMYDLKLEDLTQDLISLEHPNVPVSGMEINCMRRSWNVSSVKDSLLEMIHLNLQELKIKGTNYIDFPETLPYYKNHYVWDIGDDIQTPQIDVNFYTDKNYPHIFAVTPSTGNRMFSSQLGGTERLSFLCLQNWKFTYDLIYPVKVRLRDETTGYNFNMALTVHLLENRPNRKVATARPSISLNTITDEDYCNSKSVPMTIKTYELVENNEGVSNREDLDLVNITFTCIRYKCDVGQTEYSGNGYSGINTLFPYCTGGVIRANKDGYKESLVITPSSTDKEIGLDLVPLYKVPLNKIKVIKHEFNGESVESGKELGKNEVALIKINFYKINKSNISNKSNNETNISLNKGDLFHEAEIVTSVEMDPLIEDNAYLDLLAKADFTYDVDIKLMNQDRLVGGYIGNWTVNWDKLENVQEVQFYVLSKDTNTDEEMANLYFSLNEKSQLISSPQIK